MIHTVYGIYREMHFNVSDAIQYIYYSIYIVYSIYSIL